ncbi:MAG: O-antigen ligase family protein [Candidatus Pacebacteria bacterium]|nr:O-antigen ligase family protein [Candidatus Paceibacterota bacterium]
MKRLRQTLSILLLVPAVLPLVYIGGILYPYIAPKTFLLLFCGIAALALFAYLALRGEAFFYERLHEKKTWIPILLLIIAYLASYTGIDFYHSFWGLFERGDGLLTLTIITGYFYLFVLSATHAFLDRFTKVVTVVAGIVASIAVLQWATTIFGEGAAFLPPVTGRIGSTLGNAAFLAGYLGMALFVSLFLARNTDTIWRRIGKITAILSVFAIVFAATRGTILALIAALLIVLIFTAWKGEGQAKKFARYGCLAVIVLAGLFFAFRSDLAQSSFEPVKRIASISLSDSTTSNRLFAWSQIAAETLQRPWSGYGAEHIAQLFDTIYDPSKISEQWFDRSHNAFLDYFAQYGVFGLALYLSLIGAFMLSALAWYRREAGGLTNPGLLSLLLIITYAVQNFFVFDTSSSLWLLYALFAFLIVQLSGVSATSRFGHLPSFVPWITSGIILLTSIPTVTVPLYANILLTNGYRYHLVDINKANAYFKQGFALHTYADMEYGYQAYEMYTGHQATALSGKDRVAAYEYALSVLSANYVKYPYDARTATYLGHVLDTTPPEVAVDDVFDERVLTRAIELSPLRAQGWYMLANVYLRKADALPRNDPNRETYFREAIKILEAYIEKEPTLPVPRYTLVNLYYNLGDTQASKKWADSALPLYTTADVAAAAPAVKYYLAIGDWQHAVPFLEDLVRENPADYNTLYDLAKVSYLAGDPATAERIVQKLRIENPNIIPTDPNFLSAITAYEQSTK